MALTVPVAVYALFSLGHALSVLVELEEVEQGEES
jgi:hypothetical protein